MTDHSTLEVIKAFAPWIGGFATIFSSTVAIVVGWIKSSKERAMAAEAGMREYRLKTCQSEMNHFSWIPQHGDAFAHELSEQFYINFSKLSEFGHLVLSDFNDTLLYNKGRSIHRKLLSLPKGETLNDKLEAEILEFLDETRREMKTGLRNLVTHA